MEPVNPTYTILAILEKLRPLAQGRGVILQCSFNLHDEQITVNPNQFDQVIDELLYRVIDAAASGNRIEIRLERQGGYINFTIKDNKGWVIREQNSVYPGPEDITQYNPHPLRLDLSVVELEGGTIQVNEQEEKPGFTITVYFPIRAVRGPFQLLNDPDSQIKQTIDFQVPELLQPDVFKGIHIVVVDDSEEARNLLQTTLEIHGADVTPLNSAKEALIYLKENFQKRSWPNILISDIEMDNEDGYSLLANLRTLERERNIEFNQQLPAIALTAHAQTEDRVRAFAAGFQMHMSKPVDPIELVVVIVSLLNRNHRLMTPDEKPQS